MHQSIGRAGGPPCRGRGFTLVELIVVILITGILAAAVGLFIGSPVRGFVDQSRRAGLTDAADLALLRITRELRTALPNSVRVTASGNAIEFLPTVDGGRYRVEGPGVADDRLEIGTADMAFDTFGPLGGGAFTADQRLAVYPVGGSLGDPYTAATGVLSEAGLLVGQASVTVGGQTDNRITLRAPGHQFLLASPGRRIYLVQGPVSYACDDGELQRYDGYTLRQSQPNLAALKSLTAPVVIVDQVDVCRFSYDRTGGASRTGFRNAVVQLQVVMRNTGDPEEAIRLFRQVHVDNTP